MVFDWNKPKPAGKQVVTSTEGLFDPVPKKL
jgi:hypothetical protein